MQQSLPKRRDDHQALTQPEAGQAPQPGVSALSKLMAASEVDE